MSASIAYAATLRVLLLDGEYYTALVTSRAHYLERTSGGERLNCAGMALTDFRPRGSSIFVCYTQQPPRFTAPHSILVWNSTVLMLLLLRASPAIRSTLLVPSSVVISSSAVGSCLQIRVQRCGHHCCPTYTLDVVSNVRSMSIGEAAAERT